MNARILKIVWWTIFACLGLMSLATAIDAIHPLHLPSWFTAIGKAIIAIVAFLLALYRWIPFGLFDWYSDLNRGDGPYYR